MTHADAVDLSEHTTRSSGRTFARLAFGVALPLAAFLFDAALQVNPVIWGGGLAPGRFLEGARDAGLRPALVIAVALLSILGLLLHELGAPRRPRLALVAMPLLGTGVLFALAHAVVFAPLIGISLILVAFAGFGLLGFSPYFALWAYVSAFGESFREVARLLGGRALPVFSLALLSLLPIGAAAAPLIHVQRVVEEMRKGGPREIARGFRRLGPLAGLARTDLCALYVVLDAPGQVRMRGLYQDRFGRDIHEDVGGRLRARD